MEPAPGQSGEHAPAQVVYLAIEAQEAVAGIWAWILESAPMSIGHRHRARLGHVHGGRTGMVMPSVSARSVADALESQALSILTTFDPSRPVLLTTFDPSGAI